MEIYQLRSFVTVVHAENLSRVAEKLFLSQLAVSAHSQALEDELGLSLKNERVHAPYYLTRDAAIVDLFDYILQCFTTGRTVSISGVGSDGAK